VSAKSPLKGFVSVLDLFRSTRYSERMGQKDWGKCWAGGVVVFSLLLASACGNPSEPTPQAAAGADGAGGSPSSAGGAPGDSPSFLQAQRRGYCARLFRCVERDDDFMEARLVLKTPEGCEAELRKLEIQSPSRRDLQTQLAAGGLRYNAAAAEKCLAELSTCNGIDSFAAGSCREVYEGSAQTGEACQRSEDCAGDAYCDTASFTCPGQCHPRKPSGEACDTDAECSYTSGSVYCDQDALPAVCRTLQLGAKAGSGAPCTRQPSTDELIFCADDSWCGEDPQLGPDAAQGRCMAALKLGDPCRGGDDVCADGLCDTTAGMCKKPVLRSKVGEACNKAEMVVCDPILGLRCNDQGTCDGSGDGSLGSACFSGDFQRGCGAGLRCAVGDPGPAGTCTPLLATGAACQQNYECESGECSVTCQPRYCGF
jgi:hypothetical protein